MVHEPVVDQEVLPADEQDAREARAEQPRERGLHDERHLDVEAGRADQSHDAGLASAAERGDADRVHDQHQRHDEHQQHHAERRVVHAVQEIEEPLQGGPLVLHRLHTGAVGEGAGDDLVLGGVLELDPEGLLHLVRRHGPGDRGAAELLLVVLVRLVRRLELDALDEAHTAEVGLDLLLLVLGGRAFDTGGVGAHVVLSAEEDRDVDLVVPVALHRADLLTHEQRPAEEGERESDRDDHRESHRQISAETHADLRQDELGAHGVLSVLVAVHAARLVAYETALL